MPVERVGVHNRQAEARHSAVAGKPVRVWFDPEGDFLEVVLDPSRPGYFRETADDRVMEKVDERGTVIGFSILGISGLRSRAPMEVVLSSGELDE